MSILNKIFLTRTTVVLFFIYLLLGTAIRWNFWATHSEELNIGDYAGYSHPAFFMEAPYDTGDREPLWPWILKGWFALTKTTSIEDSFSVAQLLGFFWFPLILFLSMKFCENYFGKWQSWITGWLLTISSTQIYHEFLGLREPLEAVLVLILTILLIQKDKPPVWNRKRKWGLLIVCSGLMLTRLGYVQVLWITLPIFFLLNGWKIKSCLMILTVGFIMILPHYLDNYDRRKDPAYFTHLELGKLWGRDFKHRNTVPRNWDQWKEWGEWDVKPITLYEYLFIKHKWWQLPWTFLYGIYRYLFYYRVVTAQLIWNTPPEKIIGYPFLLHLPILFFYLQGYFYLLKDSGRKRFVALIFLLMLPYFLIGHIQINLRYSLCVLPLLLMILSNGMVWSVTRTAPNIRSLFGVPTTRYF